MWQYFLYCNDFKCRVVEFYCETETDKHCPSCTNPGHTEGY